MKHDDLYSIDVIYLRKSSIKGAEEFEKFERQKTELIELVELQGHKYEVFNDEEASSRDLERPEYVRMKEAISQGKVRAVFCIDDSRLTRDDEEALAFYSLLKKRKVKLFTLLHGEIDLLDRQSAMVSKIKAIFNAFEYDNTVTKIEEGKFRSIKAGIFNGKIPFGYERGKDKKLHPTEDAKHVVQVFQWYLAGWTTRQIGVELTRVTGKDWKSSQISRILNRRTYLGEIGYFSDFLDEGATNLTAHEPIIDKSTFLTCQTILKQRNKVSDEVRFERDRQSINTERNPLHRLVYCLDCGERRSTNTTANRVQIYFQKCIKCGNPSVPLSMLWERVLELVAKERENVEGFLDQFDHRQDDIPLTADQKLEEVQKRIDEINERLENLIDMALSGLINREQHIQRKNALETELEPLQAEAKELSEVMNAKPLHERHEKIEQTLVKMDTILDAQTSPQEVNRLLRGIVQGIYFKRSGKALEVFIAWVLI